MVLGAAVLGVSGLLLISSAIPWAAAAAGGSVGTVKLDGKDIGDAADPANDPKQTCDIVLEWQGFPADTQTATVAFTSPGNHPDPTVTFGDLTPTFVGHGKGSKVVDQKETYRLTGADLVKVTVTVDPDGYKKSKVFKYQPCGAPAAPDVVMLKTGTTTATVGSTGSYSLSVRNDGPALTAALTVTDVLPAGVELFGAAPSGTGWSCTTSAVAPQVSCTQTAATLLPAGATTSTITVPVRFTAVGVKTDQATVAAVPGETYLADNVAQLATTVTPAAGAVPDLVMLKTGTTTATVGSTGSYALSVRNDGAALTAALTVTDVLPAGVELFGAAPSGTGWSCTTSAVAPQVSCTQTAATLLPAGATTSTITVPVRFTTVGVKTDQATVATAAGETDLADNTAQLSTTVSPGFAPPTPTSPDLSIVKAGPASAVKPGDLVAYTLTVTNIGTGSATGVQVTDSLPAALTFVSASGTGFTCTGTSQLSCQLAGTLAPAASAVVNVVTRLAADYTATSVANAATVLPTDSNPANNTDTEVTPVTLPAPAAEQDLGISKSGLRDTVQPGDVLSWTITVTNVKGDPATGFTVTDEIPFGLSLLTVGGVDWTCTVSNGVVRCTYTGAPIAVGGTTSFQLDSLVAADYAGSLVANTAVVDPGGVDPTNDSATETTAVVQPSSGGGGGEVVIPTPSPTPSGGGKVLPFTGSSVDLALPVGVSLLLIGLVVSLLFRRSYSTR